MAVNDVKSSHSFSFPDHNNHTTELESPYPHISHKQWHPLPAHPCAFVLFWEEVWSLPNGTLEMNTPNLPRKALRFVEDPTLTLILVRNARAGWTHLSKHEGIRWPFRPIIWYLLLVLGDLINHIQCFGLGPLGLSSPLGGNITQHQKLFPVSWGNISA